jgi:DNA-3-methyladenine glycosylase II
MATRFTLEPVAPFRLDLTAWALCRRPGNTVDRWQGDTYRRTLRLTDAIAEIAVHQTGPPEAARLVVSVASDRPGRHIRAEVTGLLQRVLGLDVDLRDFYRRAESDPLLGQLVSRFRGLKPPRFPSIFECLVNAVACQQLTLTVGITLLNRLAEAFGPVSRGIAAHGCPEPTDIVDADRQRLRDLGFSNSKARALMELADRVTRGELDLEKLETESDEAASVALQGLRGVGRWSAEYTLLRGLGRLGVFPADDVGARNNLRRFIGLDAGAGYEDIRSAVSRWAPYSGLVYFHLLLDHIDTAGWLATQPGSSCVDTVGSGGQS